MATKQIHDYTAATGIDAAADYLLIDPNSTGVYNKINRNTLLGLASAPLGLTDSQSPTNKIFNNTNTVTLKDTNFTLQDDGDTTKQANFQLSGITTANTRTLTVPDASGTITLNAATQTLTNKTLTSPTITGGTIDNSTITVDSISGHTVATTVTVANMQIANGVINTANAVTATSIAAGAVQPQALVSGSGSGWAWQTWSPTFTGLSGGTLNYSTYTQIGKTVFFKIQYTMSGANVSGVVTFTVPKTAVTNNTNIVSSMVQFVQSSTRYFGVIVASSTTSFSIYVLNVASTYPGLSALSASVPFTWGNTDILECSGYYEAA